LELADGNWANLVIMQHAEGIQRWRTSQKHAYVARKFAPLFYSGIRIHNGVLPRGLTSPRLVLLNTKYYDFRGGRLWRAVRDERDTA
jgi:hypothetical protein